MGRPTSPVGKVVKGIVPVSKHEKEIILGRKRAQYPVTEKRMGHKIVLGRNNFYPLINV